MKKNPAIMQAPELPPATLPKKKPKLQAPDLRPKKNPVEFELGYAIFAKKGSGKTMWYDGDRFTNNGHPKQFSTAGKAKSTAQKLLKDYPILKGYRVYINIGIKPKPKPTDRKKHIAMRGGTKSNPSSRENVELDEAAKKLEDFTGHAVGHLESAYSRSNQKTGLIIGELDLVGYRAKRDGKTERYGHHFKKNSRPLLAVTSDGKQLHIVGGQYEFTEAGIEDR
jgi:hypothetical protein